MTRFSKSGSADNDPFISHLRRPSGCLHSHFRRGSTHGPRVTRICLGPVVLFFLTVLAVSMFHVCLDVLHVVLFVTKVLAVPLVLVVLDVDVVLKVVLKVVLLVLKIVIVALTLVFQIFPITSRGSRSGYRGVTVVLQVVVVFFHMALVVLKMVFVVVLMVVGVLHLVIVTLHILKNLLVY